MSNTAENSKKKTLLYSKKEDEKLIYHAYRLSRDGDQKVTVTDLICLAIDNLIEELDKEE